MPLFREGGIPMAGRKPKPTALKELEGNPGKRKLNKKEPIPGKGIIRWCLTDWTVPMTISGEIRMKKTTFPKYKINTCL